MSTAGDNTTWQEVPKGFAAYALSLPKLVLEANLVS